MSQQSESVQPIFSETSPLLVVFLLVLCVLTGSLLGAAALYGLGYLQGISVQEALGQINESSPLGLRNFIRTSTLINHLTTFILPAIFFAWFFYRRHWLAFLRLNRTIKLINVILGILFIASSFPLAQWLFQVNKAIPLPDWATTMENSAGGLITGLLRMDTPGELLFNLLIIALIPAIGEELLFRGVIQQKLAYFTRRPELAVWLAAILFSAFHLQFMGFLPRLLLGAVLGYLLFWTGNMWIPILAHFMNNAVQILVAYFLPDQLSNMNVENPQPIPFTIAVISTIFVLAIGYTIRRYNAPQQNHFSAEE